MGRANSTRKPTISKRRKASVTYNRAMEAIEVALKEGSASMEEMADVIKQSVEDPDTLLENIVQPLRSNPLLSGFLDGVATSSYNAKAEAIKKGKDPIAYVANAERRRTFIKNNIISQIQRLRSKDTVTMQTLILSLQAYRTRMNRKMWRNLTRLGVLLSRKKTEEVIMKLAGTKRKDKRQISSSVSIACYDNCGYTLHHGYKKKDQPTKIYQTVNGYHIPVPASAHDPFNSDEADEVAFFRAVHA